MLGHQSVRHSWLCTTWYRHIPPRHGRSERASERARWGSRSDPKRAKVLPPPLRLASFHLAHPIRTEPKPSGRVNVPVHRGFILRNGEDDDDDDDERSS